MTYEQLDFPRAGIGVDPCPCCGGSGIRTLAADEAIARFARESDPGTSKAAGEAVADREGRNIREVRRNTHRHRILHQFWMIVENRGMTAYEACERAGLPGGWRRVSELAAAGYIHDTGRTAPNPDSGREMALYVITSQGGRVASRLGAPKVQP